MNTTRKSLITRSVILAASTALAFSATPALAKKANKDHAHHAGHQMISAEAMKAEHDKLTALFEDSDKRSLELNPLERLFRGDDKDATTLGEWGTDSSFYAGRLNTQLNLALLAQIDRAKLDETDQLAYDVFKNSQENGLKFATDDIRAKTEVRPIDHFTGLHTFYPNFASGEGAAPFKTLANYEDNLSRHNDYVKAIDISIDKFRKGLKTGYLETSLTIDIVVKQLDSLLAVPIAKSQFMGPVQNFPEGISAADKKRLTAEYQAKTAEIYAAHTKLRNFLAKEYLPKARPTIGLSDMKGGAELYNMMIEQSTTLPLTADYLHNLGLSEVKRITEGVAKIKDEVGFKGTMSEFYEYTRKDVRFQAKSREELTQNFYDIGKQVDKKIGDYFSVIPKTPLEIKPYDEAIEQFSAGGSYENGSPDGTRPGTFFFNAYNLPERLTTGNVTLYLHEGAPGHHFQISLAQENEKLPAFMRFGGNTAYVEGWALYSETLGYEMGFYKDPWNRFGTFQDEILRAMRLVVDTGIHAKGWSRDQAVKFMMDNSGMTETEVVAEVDRYIAMPAQALAYKVGALKIQELRKKAETAMGAKFNLKEFHNQVLASGALPLPVLEAKIDRWIASAK